MKRLATVIGSAVLGLSVLAACGGGNNYGSSRSGGSSSSSAPANGPAKLATAQVADLGKVVVDGNGRTVYVFDKDGQGKSNCDGDCAAMWAPVAAGQGTPQLTGVDASMVGTVTRSDGSKQLTLGGQPLYLYANDSKAGDAAGQAVGGLWWVVGTDGKKITTQPSSGDGGNNGY